MEKRSHLLIMDMDGVVTSEQRYWDAAAFSVYEILFSDEYLGLGANFPTDSSVESMFPKVITEKFISIVKGLGINSNWDLAFLSLSLFLIYLCENSKQEYYNALLGLCESADLESFQNFKKAVSHKLPENIDSISLFTESEKKLDPFRKLNKRLGTCDIFTRESGLWKLVHKVFQNWYIGTDKIYQKGLLSEEEPVIPIEELVNSLSTLKKKGLNIAIATGRPIGELLPLLEKWDILKFFSKESICTFETIENGEKAVFKASGKNINLAKPSPYIFLKAAFPHNSPIEVYNMKPPYPFDITVVGDAAGDLMAANTMGVPAVLVSTGVGGKKGAAKLAVHKPVAILDSFADIIDTSLV